MSVLSARYTICMRHSPQAAQSQLQACANMHTLLLDTFACYACMASQDQLMGSQIGQGAGAMPSHGNSEVKALLECCMRLRVPQPDQATLAVP